ncbi:hypothetical protein SAMN04488121_103150 [Chitinophaga filiformis]|uniref:Uncharacterized protein n=1 Tax=Chitinophaga filiformis TaxID=104663 RepID=A0A1G7QQ92_CHIFI|nr:hypothetical protein SAMN04488121_103150 [Chitinophaga filiformis]
MPDGLPFVLKQKMGKCPESMDYFLSYAYLRIRLLSLFTDYNI